MLLEGKSTQKIDELTSNYNDLVKELKKPYLDTWAKKDDPRLLYTQIGYSDEIRDEEIIRSDYERRELLEQLITIYQLQFPVLHQNEARARIINTVVL